MVNYDPFNDKLVSRDSILLSNTYLMSFQRCYIFFLKIICADYLLAKCHQYSREKSGHNVISRCKNLNNTYYSIH